jgi:hypothetical protein
MAVRRGANKSERLSLPRAGDVDGICLIHKWAALFCLPQAPSRPHQVMVVFLYRYSYRRNDCGKVRYAHGDRQDSQLVSFSVQCSVGGCVVVIVKQSESFHLSFVGARHAKAISTRRAGRLQNPSSYLSPNACVGASRSCVLSSGIMPQQIQICGDPRKTEETSLR